MYIGSIVSDKPQYLYLLTWIMQSLKLLFNANTDPPVSEIHTIEPIYILFLYEESATPGEAFKYNHFVSLLFNTSSQKRKSVAGL